MTTTLIPVETAPVETVRRARRGPRRRHRTLTGVLGVVVVLLFAARVLLGDYTVTIPDFFRILDGTQIPGATFIVMELKLPQATLGLLAGLAFGLAGAIFQSTLRNPLASPDIIGVSLGASATATIAIVLFDARGAMVSVLAVAGAVGIALLVRLVAGNDHGYRLVLAGVGLAAAMQAVIQYVFTRADTYDAQLVLRWMTGSVSGADWPTIRALGVLLLVLLPLTAALARTAPASELGPEAAAGLGVPRSRDGVLLLVGVLLTAVGVAAAGPLAFVAFLSGPIARSLNQGRTTLIGSALCGAAIVLAADHAAANLIADFNFPVGVVTGALGAPVLLILLARGRLGRKNA